MDDVKWALYADMKGASSSILLNPLSWKGGDQVDSLKKILEFFKRFGNIADPKTKILIYRSQCGSGKSGVMLHVIEDMGRGIIIVPFRNLQRQYYDDYFTGKNKFVLKKNGKRLSVAVMLGRGNFPCRWLAEQYDYQQKLIEESKKPENSGIIIPIDTNIINMYNADSTCANRYLPCSRPLMSIGSRREPRWQVANACPYWIPTPTAKSTIDKWRDKAVDEKKMNAGFMEDESEGVNKPDTDRTASDVNKDAMTQLDYIQDRIKCHRIEYYDSVGWDQAGMFIRDDVDQDGNPCPDVCQYYKQFYAYTQADCIVMNDAKWEIETMIGRKPKVNIEIVDEGDYWLDHRSVSLEFSRFMIDKMIPVTNRMNEMKRNTLFLFDTAFQDIKKRIAEPTQEMKDKGVNIISSKDYKELFMHIMNMVLEYKKSVEEDDTTLQKMVDLATVLKYIEKASISIEEGKREEFKTIKIFIPYPDNLLKELFKKSSSNIIITSGTIHSNLVLGSLFGINNDNYIVEFVEGRKESPGKLKCIKPNLLRVNHTSWQNPEFRKVYDNTMNYILDQLKIRIDKITGKPGEGRILVLTPAKKYAKGIINRPDVFVDFAKSKNEDDGTKPSINTSLTDFMEKSIEDVRKIKPTDIEINGDVLRTDKQIIVSTRMIRGADLRDNKCRAVVMTKWPMSDISAGYNQALKVRFGEKIFWAIQKDKATRESIQYVSRGLRHDLDWEFFSTPDEDAFNRVFMLFTYE
jgi:hypothetical protein